MIEIRDPEVEGERKFAKALEVLSKAYKKPIPFDDETLSKEVSPYRSVRDLEHQSKMRVELLLLELFDEVRRKWLGLQKAADSSHFKLNGKTLINPKTGKPLTVKEWKQIRQDLLDAFSFIYEKEEERLVKAALALGKVLHSMEVPKAISTTLPAIKLTADRIESELADPYYFNTLTFAEENTAQDIVELSNKHYSLIHDTIVQAQKERIGARELESRLFDNFGAMNRDWRMISETEIATNTNNGKLLAQLQQKKPGEVQYMKGISAADACDWCVTQVNDRVVVLLEAPPDGGGDTVVVNNVEYVAIWPGKSNVGRRRADWWVASGAQHPHCRCTWVRHTPGFEKWDQMLKDSMDQASAEWWKEHPIEAEKKQWKEDNKRLWNKMKIEDLKAERAKKNLNIAEPREGFEVDQD